MPIIWKLLIFRYLKTFFFCGFSLIFISIIGSLQEIVSFIAKDVPYTTVLKLAAYQIPYLLPFIIPISCFVGALSLFKSLSENNQIIFLRASGASFKLLIFPIIVVAIAISCINFYTCSELASICRLKTSKELANLAVKSPSLLIQTLQKTEDNRVFISVDRCIKSKFNNVILAFKRDGEIANLGVIQTLIPNISEDAVSAKNVVLISKIPANLNRNKQYPEFYIETIDELLIPKISSTVFSGKSHTKKKTDYLPWKQLIAHSKQFPLSQHLPEIIRRINIGFLCITFTFSGIVLGTYKPRFQKNYTPFFLLPIVMLTLFIVGKNTKTILPAIMIFIVPQLCTCIFFGILANKELKGT